MKTFLVFVSTVDGKITRWGDPLVRKWSSKEDQEYFSALMQKSPLVVLGSNTYLADPIKPRENRLLLVLTSNPDRFKNQEVPGQLEFINQNPTRLIEIYKDKGFEKMLVAGGPRVATSFIKEKLIDELWLTIEPHIFGTGGSFVTDEDLNIQLELISIEKLNIKGTLLLKYTVKR